MTDWLARLATIGTGIMVVLSLKITGHVWLAILTACLATINAMAFVEWVGRGASEGKR